MHRTRRIVFSFSYSFSKRIFPALIVSAILAACGGGGGGSDAASTATNSSSPSPAAGNGDSTNGPSTGDDSSGETPSEQPAPGKPTQAVVIDYYGDSTVWGYESGSGARVATPAPAAFAAALGTPSRYTVRNEGVNSSDACQLLNGRDGRHPAWDTQMAASNADVVILNHAINDQGRLSIAEYQSCLTALATTAKSHGKKVIFETPNPIFSSSLSVYANAMKTVAAQQGAPVIDQYNYLLAYLNGKSAYTICPDGLHPTEAVYAMKGKYAAEVFGKMGI